MTTENDFELGEFPVNRSDNIYDLLEEKYLKEPVFGRDNEALLDIHFDFLNNNMNKAIQFGFSWKQVIIVCDICQELLTEHLDKSITECIHIYKSQILKCVDNGTLPGENVKLYNDYFINSFFAHFRLYKLVFNKKRENWRQYIAMEIEKPPEVPSMRTCQPMSVYNYERAISVLENREQIRQVEFGKKIAEEIREDTNRIKQVENELDVDEDAIKEKEKLSAIIAAISSAQIESLNHSISRKIEDSMAVLDFKLQKTLVPRPQILDENDDDASASDEFDLSELPKFAKPKSRTSRSGTSMSLRRKSDNRLKTNNAKAGQPPRYDLSVANDKMRQPSKDKKQGIDRPKSKSSSRNSLNKVK